MIFYWIFHLPAYFKNLHSVVFIAKIVRSMYVIRLHCKKGPVRIQYKCLVPNYVFREMKMKRGLIISKTEL
jgi:hypothetical protein